VKIIMPVIAALALASFASFGFANDAASKKVWVSGEHANISTGNASEAFDLCCRGIKK